MQQAYIILGLRKACEKLPEALEKIAPVLIYPVVGILAMGLLMLFIVEPIMGTVNMALNNGLASMGGSSKLILGMILGGMMAIDMGGPFNKAAYVFGTAAIAAGNYDIMASVMIGGMVPPCAIALATLLFKDKFTKEERESGPTNFIMGLASSPRVRFHSQQQTRSTFFRPASSAPASQVRSPWHLAVP